MKKITTFLLFCLSLSAFGQISDDSDDFFSGKWNINVFGTPQGDVNITADLKRVEGELTGTLETDAAESLITITEIEEKQDAIDIAFFAQGYDLVLSLKKVDDDHLEGSMMDMFDAKAERIIELDFFVGEWTVNVHDTPQGDIEIIADLYREGDMLTGTLTSTTESEPIQIRDVEETETSIAIDFYAQGYDLVLNLKKVDEDHLEGDLSDMFNAEAERIKEADDFFAGDWELEFIGTPNGDAKMLMSLSRNDHSLIGNLTPMGQEGDEIMITDINEEESSIEIFFSAQGYQVSVKLEIVDENNLSGSLMDLIDAKARRVAK
jgi:phage protein U